MITQERFNNIVVGEKFIFRPIKGEEATYYLQDGDFVEKQNDWLNDNVSANFRNEQGKFEFLSQTELEEIE